MASLTPCDRLRIVSSYARLNAHSRISSQDLLQRWFDFHIRVSTTLGSCWTSGVGVQYCLALRQCLLSKTPFIQILSTERLLSDKRFLTCTCRMYVHFLITVFLRLMDKVAEVAHYGSGRGSTSAIVPSTTTTSSPVVMNLKMLLQVFRFCLAQVRC
jgi:hypothetical protein